MNVKPVNKRILLKIIDSEQVTSGGIYIPQKEEKPGKGVVVSALDDQEVKEGDTVIFSKYTGYEIEVGNEKHILVKEEDILCVIE